MTVLCSCTCGALESTCRTIAVGDFLAAHDHGGIRLEAVYADGDQAALCRFAGQTR